MVSIIHVKAANSLLNSMDQIVLFRIVNLLMIMAVSLVNVVIFSYQTEHVEKFNKVV